jgi:hypothetical protein
MNDVVALKAKLSLKEKLVGLPLPSTKAVAERREIWIFKRLVFSF